MELVEMTWVNRLLLSVIAGLVLGGIHALVAERSKMGRVLGLPILFFAMLFVASKGLSILGIVASALAAMTFTGMYVKKRKIKFAVFESSMALGLIIGVIALVYPESRAPIVFFSGIYVGYSLLLSLTLIPFVFLLPGAFVFFLVISLLIVFLVGLRPVLGVSLISGDFILAFLYGLILAALIEVRLMWSTMSGLSGRAQKKLPSLLAKITRKT